MNRLSRFGKVSVCLAVMLCTSSLSWAQAQEKSFGDMVSKFVLVPPGEPESEMLARAAVAVNFIKRYSETESEIDRSSYATSTFMLMN